MPELRDSYGDLTSKARRRLLISGAVGLAVGASALANVSLAQSQSAADALRVPTGAHSYGFDNRGEVIKVSTYKPPTYKDGPIILVAHGSGRSSDEYRDNAIVMAERYGAIIVVPEFDWAKFSNERYKRNGGVTRNGVVQPRSQWTYDLIDRVVKDVKAREKRDLPYYVIGHSGGAQITVRMALFLPDGPQRFVSANSGSYTFLDKSVNYPYGLGGLPDELTNDTALKKYLAAPLVLFLGTGDTRTGRDYFGDPARVAASRARYSKLKLNGRLLTPAQVEERVYDGFDNSAEANAQGVNRNLRGQNFFASSKRLAESKGWPFSWRLITTEGVGHSGAEMFKAPEVEEALFGKSASK